MKDWIFLCWCLLIPFLFSILFIYCFLFYFFFLQENPLTNVKNLDCALCRRTLEMKIRRTKYVAVLWNEGNLAELMNYYGWYSDNEVQQPVLFQGEELPISLINKGNHRNLQPVKQYDWTGTLMKRSLIAIFLMLVFLSSLIETLRHGLRTLTLIQMERKWIAPNTLPGDHQK